MSDIIDPKVLNSFFSKPCDFKFGVANADGLPPESIAEVAFAGRSNVGKSSLLNALLNRKSLARVSGTPGCTQQINFFQLDEKLYLVDMPGYGYAKTSKKNAKLWSQLILEYLRGRVQLRRLFLLIDCRRGILDTDKEIMKILDDSAVSYQLVLSKTDALKPDELKNVIEESQKTIKKHPACLPVILATSSEKMQGIDELRTELYSLLHI